MIASAGPFESEAEVRDAIGSRDWEPGEHRWRNEAALLAACVEAGVDLGAYDERIVRWLAGWEPQTVAVIVGIILRAACDRPGGVAERPPSTARRATYTCVYRYCADQHYQLEPAAAERWMDEHAREVAHDRRWPITFRIDYPHNPLPGVAYRDPVKLIEEPAS